MATSPALNATFRIQHAHMATNRQVALDIIASNLLAPVDTAAVGATSTLTTAKYQTATLDQNGTIEFPAVTTGCEIFLQVTGAFSLTFGTGAVYHAATAPTYASSAVYHIVTLDGAGAAWLVDLIASTVA